MVLFFLPPGFSLLCEGAEVTPVFGAFSKEALRELFPESLQNPIHSSFCLRDCGCTHISVYCVLPCPATS